MCARAYNAAATLYHVASIIGFPAGERAVSSHCANSTRRRPLTPSSPLPSFTPPSSTHLVVHPLFFQSHRRNLASLVFREE